LLILKLKKEITVSNVDNTPNKNGPIGFHTQLLMIIDGKTPSVPFLISNLRKITVLWLKFVNPEVDWAKRHTTKMQPQDIQEPIPVIPEEDQPNKVDNTEIPIRANTSISQRLAHEAEMNKKKSCKDLVPKSVFQKNCIRMIP
ncbi:hypothetical protein K443DRAFT_101262, partial [Laccaria amethystina LaAM-08-1]